MIVNPLKEQELNYKERIQNIYYQSFIIVIQTSKRVHDRFICISTRKGGAEIYIMTIDIMTKGSKDCSIQNVTALLTSKIKAY